MTLDLDVHLAAIAAGDAKAFAAWLAGAEQPLRFRLRPFAAAVDTEAVLQEALLRIWQVAPRVQPDGKPNSLLRFALRTARNLAVDQVRRSRHLTVADLEPALAEDGPVEVHEPDPLLREAIRACREKLPKAPAKALSARLDGAGARSDRDLAERVGMTVNTFLKNIGRARTLLLACLERGGIVLEVP